MHGYRVPTYCRIISTSLTVAGNFQNYFVVIPGNSMKFHHSLDKHALTTLPGIYKQAERLRSLIECLR